MNPDPKWLEIFKALGLEQVCYCLGVSVTFDSEPFRMASTPRHVDDTIGLGWFITIWLLVVRWLLRDFEIIS
jgi:hypothetical protein